MDNTTIARRLLEHARELAGGTGHLYRAQAYRRAAAVIGLQARPVREMREGELAALPGIGRHLAYTIATLAATGEFRTWAERPGRRAG
jgi:DNA polymerase/3'-5' exonuclease PolX